MSEEQIKSLKILIREVVRGELRDIFAEVVNEYEFSYERSEKIEQAERELKAPFITEVGQDND